MIRRPPRSTQSRSSAASDVYKRQVQHTMGSLTERLACTEGPSLRGLNGTPEWIRATDLLLRRQTLYPSELRAHNGSTSIVVTFRPEGQTAISRLGFSKPRPSMW